MRYWNPALLIWCFNDENTSGKLTKKFHSEEKLTQKKPTEAIGNEQQLTLDATTVLLENTEDLKTQEYHPLYSRTATDENVYERQAQSRLIPWTHYRTTLFLQHCMPVMFKLLKGNLTLKITDQVPVEESKKPHEALWSTHNIKPSVGSQDARWYGYH